MTQKELEIYLLVAVCIPVILTPYSGKLTPDIGFTVAVSQASAFAIGRLSR